MSMPAVRPATTPTGRNAIVFEPAPKPLRVHVGGGHTVTDARILSVLETVARELEKPQLVKHLAARLRLSRSRFEHLFKQQTGQAFQTFLRAARMARARIMLRDLTLRIKEVAAAVGYADVSDFTRDFRKQYGRPPSQLRGPSRHHPSIPSSPRRGLSDRRSR